MSCRINDILGRGESFVCLYKPYFEVSLDSITMANKYTPTYDTVFNTRILSNEEKNVLLEALMDIATPEWKTEDGGFTNVAFDVLQTVFAEKNSWM